MGLSMAGILDLEQFVQINVVLGNQWYIRPLMFVLVKHGFWLRTD